ncbi:putative autophagy-related protein 27 [Lyophyllum shimeji]|uniref:Autophagy-related protein 27 n=1 Tax=Lyophyllum shimeji TaxID=47721 RepID=A0A9P3PJM6_LYOSH|nr:putative autophagy-related protein 27 [Lyophyllum shimeji]
MIIRRLCSLPTFLLPLLLLTIPAAAADDDPPFDCKPTVDGLKFDLTSLAGEHTASRTRSLPPSSSVDILRFDLCADLKKVEDVDERDQCPSGTRACLTQTNKKDKETDRIISVIPLMNASSERLTFSAGASTQKFITIISEGPEYPHPIDSKPTPQSLNMTLLCSPGDTKSDPVFKSYDGSKLVVEWSVPAGCPIQEHEEGSGGDSGKDDDNGPKDDNTQSAGSGIGWFFLVLILALAAYLGLGAYYNYSTYGARGADLIPHRDFWKEVPYMLSDVISHLCSSVRPRRSANRGYVAV